MPKLLLIDSMGLVFRAYHAFTRSGLASPTGEPTAAIFGFVNIVTSILEKFKPDYVAAVFDTAAPTFRHQMYEPYKANRLAFPEDLGPQLVRIKEFVSLAGIRQVEVPGFEADDIVGTLAQQAAREGMDVVCVTSDKDYFQLVTENVLVYRPGKEAGDYDRYGPDEVKVKFGVYPNQVVDVLALMGDSSDNIPGVKGVGEKTAIPLIEKYGSLDALYDHLDEVDKPSVKKKLEESREMAFLSKQLVTIHCNMDLDFGPSDCPRASMDFTAIDAMFENLGFNTLRRRFQNLAAKAGGTERTDSADPNTNGGAAPPPESRLKRADTVEHSYTLVRTQEQLDECLKSIGKGPVVSFDLETTSLDAMSCEIVGLALSVAPHTGYFVYCAIDDGGVSTLSDPKGEQAQSSSQTGMDFSESSVDRGVLTTSQVCSAVKPILEDLTLAKCGQNAKFDSLILRRYGIIVNPITIDSMIASYVLNPDDQHGMDALSEKWLQYSPIPISTLIGEKKKGSMRDASPEAVAEYAAEDADVTLQLCNVLGTRLAEEGLIDFARRVEFDLIPVLTEMEYNGVKVDTSVLTDISRLIREQVGELREKIFKESELEFNIDSPKQVGEILFERMGLPAPKKTKTGYSTDASVLQELSAIHPIANLILEHRQLQKLQSTYVESLPKMINRSTGRVHTTMQQTVAATGRLSSADPNLQNIPVKTELGRAIRRAFVADEGTVLLSADYSQIELRIMADFSSDPTLVAAFRDMLDIHAATAATLFNVELDQVSPAQRRTAKTVNFGIMYGQGPFGLSQQLGIPQREAKQIISQYFERYAGIKDFFDSTVSFTREKGYSQTMLGRRRYFPNITSKNNTIRQAAERAAINTPIQGSAADMMKLAMVGVNRQMKNLGLRSKMILQIHDELLFEALVEEIDTLIDVVKEQMIGAMPLGQVPLVVDTGTGANWADAH